MFETFVEQDGSSGHQERRGCMAGSLQGVPVPEQQSGDDGTAGPRAQCAATASVCRHLCVVLV